MNLICKKKFHTLIKQLPKFILWLGDSLFSRNSHTIYSIKKYGQHTEKHDITDYQNANQNAASLQVFVISGSGQIPIFYQRWS